MCQRIIFISLLFLFNIQWGTGQGISVKKLAFCKSSHDEMAPIVYNSVLYFSSNKNIKWLNKSTDQNNQNFYNIFSVRQGVDSSWVDFQQLEPNYFSEFHTSSITFSPSNNKVYFTENHYGNRKRLKGIEENLHGVFEADIVDDKYSRAKGLPFNSKRSYNTAQPTISSDGRIMFFVSDQPGGYGETDIYMSEFDGNEWGPGINLGFLVNSSGKELFPFYHPSGKLYFSSNGLGGEGGMEIFYTRQLEDGWAKPVSIGKEINSSANEFSCYINDDGQSGYFASDREGSDDIYEFIHLFPVFGPGQKQKENTFKYRFFDRMNGKGDGPVKYVWHFGDGEKAEGDTVIHQYKKPGNYHVQSLLVDTLENLELFVLNDFYQEVKKKIQVYINCSEKVKVGEEQVLDAKQSNLGDFESNGFYWELPDGTKQKGETIKYIFRTKGIHVVKCGTISKTDPNLKMCTYKEINVID